MNKPFSSSPIWLNTGLAFVRCVLGGFLIYHGHEIFNGEAMNGYLQWDMFKDSSSSKTMIYAGKAAELVAGILFVVGLFTRIAAILTIGTLGYIAFFVGSGKVWADDQHPFLFVLLGLVFFFTGPGKWSVDHCLFKKKPLYR
ncbi:MAG: DoxX family protein [Chitinophagaceae bacterium]